ncbi:MAG: amino acid permease, partial [Candidatus Methanomethylophilaceae archaeon]|nr:amino acid permease [Candidatus Methanomethylophilaceae archaeon]
MFIALGVPLLILPSIYDVASIIWGLCIFVWTISVLQGFVQNLAYGEMVTLFPNATGLPGCAQAVFTDPDCKSKIDKGKLIGAFSAWCYWFAWCPVVAIFTMMIGDYLVQMFSLDLSGWAAIGMYMAIGVVIVLVMYVLGARGLEGG